MSYFTGEKKDTDLVGTFSRYSISLANLKFPDGLQANTFLTSEFKTSTDLYNPG